MSAEQQPVQSEASGVDIFDEAAAIGNHRVEEMRIAGDDHNDQSLTAEGKGEESSSDTYSRQPAEGNESGCNADTVNNKQNSNDKQEKQLDSRPSSTSSAAAAKAKAPAAIKVASTSKLAAKSSQEPTVPLPTAVVLPFGNQPPSVDLPAGLPLLRIQRLYRDEQGTEYQKTELVEHPQVIENYLKLRTLVGHEQLRDFAFSDQKSLQDFKQFRRNITKRLVYHHNSKKQHELKDEASRKQQSGKKVQKHGRSASEMNNSSVEQFGLRVSRKSPSLPATRQLSNKKLIGVGPDLSHLNCHACGQKGHIRTNKICPKHPANQSKMMEEVANGSSSSGISKKADTDNELTMLAALSIKQNAKPPSTPLDITRSRSSTAIIDVKTEPMESRQSTSVCSSGYSTSSAENNRNSNAKLLAMANGQKMVGQTMVRAGLRRPNAGKKRRFSPGVEEDQPQHLTEKRR